MRTPMGRWVLVAALGWTATTAQADWKSPTQVAETGQDSQWSQIAVGPDGALHLVWQEGPFLGNTEILYSSRKPGGFWSPTENVSNRPTSPSSYPDVEVTSDGVVHVVWDDGSSFTGREIYYSALTSGVWSTPLSLSVTNSIFPALQVGDDDTVYLLYTRTLSGIDAEILFAEKPPGAGWSPSRNLSNQPEDAHDPQLLIDGDHLYVAYWEWADPTDSDYDVFFVERPPGGDWSLPINVSDSNVWSTDVRLAQGPDGTLHAVWREGPGFDPGDIVHAERPPGGRWSSPQNLSLTGQNDSNDPVVFVQDDGTVHVAYYEWVSPQSDVLHVRRTPDGDWTSPVSVSGTPATTQDFSVRFQERDGALRVYWQTVYMFGEFDSDFYEATFDGTGWGTPRSLTPARPAGLSIGRPDRAPDGSVHWAYFGSEDGSGPSQVYHLRSDGPPPTRPVNLQFLQDQGSGQVGTPSVLSALYSDANGSGNVRRHYLLLNTQLTPAGGLVVLYDSIAGQLGLQNVSGGGLAGTCAPGEATVIANSVAELDCASSSIDRFDEDEVTVSWNVRFTSCLAAGCGEYRAGMFSQDLDGLAGGPSAVGVWRLDP